MPNSTIGEIEFSLCYRPSEDKIKVIILRAQNLHKIKDPETGVFVKVKLHHARSLVKAKKTKVVKGTLEPAWNEMFTFNVEGKLIDSVNIRIMLATTRKSRRLDSGSSNYGSVVVGPFMFARGSEMLHWQEMLSKPETWTAKLHRLSPAA